jgi:hypothetical protein
MGWVSQSIQRLATGWTVRGIESRWGRDFSHTSRPVLGPTQTPVQWVLGKVAGALVLTTHPLLAPRLRMSRAILLLPLWALHGLL